MTFGFGRVFIVYICKSSVGRESMRMRKQATRKKCATRECRNPLKQEMYSCELLGGVHTQSVFET